MAAPKLISVMAGSNSAFIRMRNTWYDQNWVINMKKQAVMDGVFFFCQRLGVDGREVNNAHSMAAVNMARPREVAKAPTP